jgi:3'-5' exonuclease
MSADDNGDGSPNFLVFDTETIPDGKLLGLVKYPGENLAAEEAVRRAQEEARERSYDGSDFIPVTFQVPVAVCMARVGADYHLQRLTCLDAPSFRPARIVNCFWRGVELYPRAKLVTYNGRGFDLPLLEVAAFRYGCAAAQYFRNSRHRYSGHFDLMDWMGNYGACRLSGGLNLFSKILGQPGKMDVSGRQVYQMYLEGRVREINEYCMFDTLDTYFVFLRTRVLTGELTLEQEHDVVAAARCWIEGQLAEIPALKKYLDNWGAWTPWP